VEQQAFAAQSQAACEYSDITDLSAVYPGLALLLPGLRYEFSPEGKSFGDDRRIIRPH
jgi:hypothetical protein